MKICLGSRTGKAVAAPDQTLLEIHASLAQQQKLWADTLANDPAAFALLEPQIHLAFQHYADLCAASLLAQAAALPACAEAAKKKLHRPTDHFASLKHAHAACVCSADWFSG